MLQTPRRRTVGAPWAPQPSGAWDTRLIDSYCVCSGGFVAAWTSRRPRSSSLCRRQTSIIHHRLSHQTQTQPQTLAAGQSRQTPHPPPAGGVNYFCPRCGRQFQQPGPCCNQRTCCCSAPTGLVLASGCKWPGWVNSLLLGDTPHTPPRPGPCPRPPHLPDPGLPALGPPLTRAAGRSHR